MDLGPLPVHRQSDDRTFCGFIGTRHLSSGLSGLPLYIMQVGFMSSGHDCRDRDG
jgi:hypothetical protein